MASMEELKKHKGNSQAFTGRQAWAAVNRKAAYRTERRNLSGYTDGKCRAFTKCRSRKPTIFNRGMNARVYKIC